AYDPTVFVRASLQTVATTLLEAILLVVVVVVFNLPQIFPLTRAVVGDPFFAGLVAMVLTEAAYMAEIHRSGLQSVARGQREAGRALAL
ncbi:hypothetical protein ABTJ52_20735, partial [Acinetobacter baumannii]